jgi:hypothetical protein
VPNFGSAIQTNKIPVLGLRPEAAGSAPASPAAGQLWVDTGATPPVVKYYDGASWVRANGADMPDGTVTNAKVASAAAIALSKLATDPLARANHTGTQLASTISDLAAIVQAYRLDQFAAPTSAVGMGGQRLTNLGTPTTANDGARLADVQNAAAGIDLKPSVRAASTGNVNVSSPGATIDAVTMATLDRVLLKAQTTATENGLYVWNGAAAAMTRTTDILTPNTFVFVEEGGTLADTAWMITNNGSISVGGTAITWAQFGSASAYQAGAGLLLTGNVIDVIAADGSIVVNPDSITVGLVPITKGGTGAVTAAAARTALGAGGTFAADLPALSAGVAQNVTHNLGTFDVRASVYDKTSKADVEIDVTNRPDVNTISVRADLAYASAALRIVVQG